jgi:inorganic pyrophosphatase
LSGVKSQSLAAIPTFAAGGRSIHVVIEAPAGSRTKAKLDVGLGAFLFRRDLPVGMRYPYPWGFVPSTRAADGDPLDAMIVADIDTWPGMVVEARPIAVMRVLQRDRGRRAPTRNDRILAVPVDMATRAISRELRRELEDFFVRTGRLAHPEVRVERCEGARAALRVIRRAREP